MKVIFFNRYFCFLFITLWSNLESKVPLLTSDNQPTELLLEFLDIQNIPYKGTLSSLITNLHEQWLKRIRPPGTERWEIDHEVIEEFETQASQLMPYLKKFGFVDHQFPYQHSFHYAVLLGSDMSDFCKRLDYLNYLYEQGIHFEKVIVLTGQRILSPKETKMYLQKCLMAIGTSCNLHDINGPLTTETQMVQAIMNHARVPWKAKVEIIHTPPTYVNGIMKRPNTTDTVIEWLKYLPQPGSILAISTQPFVLYQDIVLKRILPKNFYIETVARQALPSVKMAVYLDTLVRYLYVAEYY